MAKRMTVKNMKLDLTQNVDKFLKHISKKIDKYEKIDSYERIMLLFSVMKSEDSVILEARWGLDDGVYCHKFSKLAEKLDLDIDFAKKSYYEADKNMSEICEFFKFIDLYTDIEDMDAVALEKSYNYGMLWEVVLGSVENVPKMSLDNMKSRTIKVLETISEIEGDAVKYAFGIGNHDITTFDEIAYVFGVSQERLRQILNRALRKLRHPSRKDMIYGDSMQNLSSENELEKIELSQRSYIRLKNAGIDTIEKLKAISRKELVSVKDMDLKCFTEILAVKEKLTEKENQ